MSTGIIKILGPFPPPSGVVGPFARKTESYVYQIFNGSGLKLVGGTFGPDRVRCIEYATRIAREKGLFDPRITGR